MFKFIIGLYTYSFIGGVVSAVAGGLLGNKGQKDSNAASAASIQKQMDFQERMSNTSYQRGMADMKKAGLNPMLAMHQGGASVPNGSSMEFKSEMAPLANSAKNLAANVAQIENVKANTAKAEAESDLASAQAAETMARTPTHEANINLTNAQISKINNEIPKILSEIDVNHQTFQKIMAEVNNVVKTGKLIDAQTLHNIAGANLSNAQVSEVVPRINNLIANTRHTGVMTDKGIAELPMSELKGSFSDLANIPKALSKDGNSASQVVKDYGWFFRNSIDNFKRSMRENRKNRSSAK